MLAHHDAALAVHPLEERRARRNRTRAAHDGVVGIDAERREEGVHRAAHAAVEAGLAREDLAERAEDDELDGQVRDRAAMVLLQRPEDRAVQIGPHDLEQRLLVGLADRGEPLRQNLAVAAVRAVDVIVWRQEERHPDRGGLLSDRQVGGPEMIVGDAFVQPLRLDLVQDRLELAGSPPCPARWPGSPVGRRPTAPRRSSCCRY